MQRLGATLDRIDRKGYGAYRDLSGPHDFDSFTLSVDRVQRDPFAPPSLIRIRTTENPFDPKLFDNPVRKVAFEDFLTRSVEREIRRVVRGNRGSGGSGRGRAGRLATRWSTARHGLRVSSGFGSSHRSRKV